MNKFDELSKSTKLGIKQSFNHGFLIGLSVGVLVMLVIISVIRFLI